MKIVRIVRLILAVLFILAFVLFKADRPQAEGEVATVEYAEIGR